MIDRQSINASLLSSVIAILIVVLILAGSALSFAGALFGPRVNDDDPGKEFARLVDQHQEKSAIYRERFSGRSIFYSPQPWPQPPRPEPPRVEPPEPDPREVEHEEEDEPEEPVEPPPPPPPSTYEGPEVLFVLGNEVYFRTGDDEVPMVRVAVRSRHAELGVHVIDIDSPRTVTLGHRGGEYEVPLFTWGMPGIQSESVVSSEDSDQIPGLVTRTEDGEERVRRSGRSREDDGRVTGRPSGRATPTRGTDRGRQPERGTQRDTGRGREAQPRGGGDGRARPSERDRGRGTPR